MFLTVPDEEPQGPQFKKFPQSRTVDEGSPFKATCALDDVETGKKKIKVHIMVVSCVNL